MSKLVKKIENVIIPGIILKLQHDRVVHTYNEDEHSIVVKDKPIEFIEELVISVYNELTDIKNSLDKFSLKQLGDKVYIYFYTN